MSLINDALKRAKEAPPAPTPNLQLRPADPPATARHGIGLFVPVSLAAIALAGLFFIWQWSRTHSAKATERLTAQARSIESAIPVAPEPAPLVAATQATAENSRLAQAGGQAPSGLATNGASPNASNLPSANVRQGGLAATSPEPGKTETNTAAMIEPPPETPPPLKLQGIVFSPTRPSALISGRTLFIGDRIRDCRVVAITQNTATLSNGEQKTVLTLEH